MDTTKLTPWEESLAANIRALQPGVIVETSEEPRAFYSIQRVVNALNITFKNSAPRRVIHWSAVRTVEYDANDLNKTTALSPSKLSAEILKFAEPTDDPASKKGEKLHIPGVLVLSDPVPFLDSRDSAGTVRALREALWIIRKSGAYKTVVLLGENIRLDEAVMADFWSTRYELPTAAELESVLRPVLVENEAAFGKKVQIDLNVLPHFARACAGLTESTTRGLLTRALIKHTGIDMRAVGMAHDEKRAIVKRSGIATLKEPRGGLELVGGLTNFKAYIGEIDPLFKDLEAARKFGCRFPSGAILTGVPGTGKSLMAEALAGHWKLPLLTMEMGALFGSLVGESESKLRQFQALAQAIRPCVVFIDEMEKGIGGSGESDGGTTQRFKQSLLTWLQDKPDDIIVIATANRIEAFESNPEFLRRFDTIWFVDLPDEATRAEIAGIHLKRAGHALDSKALAALAAATKMFSGAEIERIVQRSLRKAFVSKRKPTQADLLEVAKEIVPLSSTMQERIAQLRAYCKDGRAMLAGASVDADFQKAAAASLPRLNMTGPQL